MRLRTVIPSMKVCAPAWLTSFFTANITTSNIETVPAAFRSGDMNVKQEPKARKQPDWAMSNQINYAPSTRAYTNSYRCSRSCACHRQVPIVYDACDTQMQNVWTHIFGNFSDHLRGTHRCIKSTASATELSLSTWDQIRHIGCEHPQTPVYELHLDKVQLGNHKVAAYD